MWTEEESIEEPHVESLEVNRRLDKAKRNSNFQNGEIFAVNLP